MGWNGSQEETAAKLSRKPAAGDRKARPYLRAVAAGGVVVIGSLVAMTLLFRSAAPDGAEAPRRGVKASAIADNGQNAVKAKPMTAEETAKATARPQKPMSKMTQEERMAAIEKRLKELPAFSPSASNQNFRTGTEQLMNWIFNCRLGDTPPPMPNLPIKDLVHLEEILSTPNPIKEGDSEEMAERKRMVDFAKKEFADYLAKGGKPEEFLEFYRNELIDAHNEYVEYRNQAFQIVREEPELADAFVREINKNLEAKGIKPVEIPPPMRKRYGLDVE